MPQNSKRSAEKSKTRSSAAKTASNSAARKAGAKKRPVKKQGSRGSAGAGKKRTSQRKRKKQNTAWWCWPVTIIMLFILGVVGVTVAVETKNYEEFKMMRSTVSFDGFHQGVSIDGVDVGGRQQGEVLMSLKNQEESIQQQLSLTLVCGNQTWNIVADDLDYQSDYESVVGQAYKLGRDGTVRERYYSIQKLNQSGAAFTITRGYDLSLLKIITDQIADELSYDAVDATVSDFDTKTLKFAFTDAAKGCYVNAEQLYASALQAIQSGVGGQTIVISQEVVEPKVTRSELEDSFGKITEAKTSTSGSNKNRLNNIELALSTLDGLCIEPGMTFSFNSIVGQRTKERGYKTAGAIVDGLMSEELGGGICQVSTTLFNAVAKADLEITERQPHSRPVGYVDEGKDAAVSWPNQDFKFTNNTDFPVYLVAGLNDTRNRCIISVYGRQLPEGQSIVIESYITETLVPEEDRYIYTTDLPTGSKVLVEKAREGYKTTAYKIYLNANGEEIRREVLCNSKYNAAGAVYNVGQ